MHFSSRIFHAGEGCFFFPLSLFSSVVERESLYNLRGRKEPDSLNPGKKLKKRRTKFTFFLLPSLAFTTISNPFLSFCFSLQEKYECWREIKVWAEALGVSRPPHLLNFEATEGQG